jgi:O-antigen/teichoic acid export membrane protein
MMGITFLSLLLMQVDKVLLSRLLSLSEYGYYTLAAVVASALYMMINPITQAFYPKLCQLIAQKSYSELISVYHEAAQLATVVVGSIAIMVVLFSEPLLLLWTGDPEMARRVAPLASLLALGNLLNCLMWIPYATQVAYGWTGLMVKINTVAVLVIVPAILWAVPRYGPEGAAWVWVMLNAAYVLVGVNFMYRRILIGQRWIWYSHDIMFPLIAGTIAGVALANAWPKNYGGMISNAVLLTVAIGTIGFACLLAAKRVRLQSFTIVFNCWRKVKARYAM